MGLGSFGRRLFLKKSAAAGAASQIKSASEAVNPLSKLKKLVGVYTDARAAGKIAKIAQGDKIMMSRRKFLKGAAKEAKAAAIANPGKTYNSTIKPLAKAVRVVTDPVGAAQSQSGVKIGKLANLAKKIGGALGGFSRRSRLARFSRRFKRF